MDSFSKQVKRVVKMQPVSGYILPLAGFGGSYQTEKSNNNKKYFYINIKYK